MVIICVVAVLALRIGSCCMVLMMGGQMVWLSAYMIATALGLYDHHSVVLLEATIAMAAGCCFTDIIGQ